VAYFFWGHPVERFLLVYDLFNYKTVAVWSPVKLEELTLLKVRLWIVF